MLVLTRTTHIRLAVLALTTCICSTLAFIGTASAATTTLTPTADTFAQQAAPSAIGGASNTLHTDGGDTNVDQTSILRFVVPALATTVTNVKLRVYVRSGSVDGPGVYFADATPWSEASTNWDNRPRGVGSALADTMAFPVGWASYDLGTAASTPGTYSFVLKGDATDGAAFDSREGANRPQLVLTSSDTTPPTTPGTLTANVSGDDVTLNWSAATDNVGVTGYQVLEGATLRATTTALTYIRANQAPGSTATYAVRAIDAAGNVGATRTVTATVPAATTTPTGFTHPGVVTSRAQLDFVKARLTLEPWKSALARLKSANSLGQAPHTDANVLCDNGSDNGPYIGCEELQADATVAYTDALLWYYTGDVRYRDHALLMLNTRSSNLRSIPFDPIKYGNGLLVTAWSAELFTKAAEIMRYSNSGWKATDIARFEGMLRTIFLPNVINGWKAGAVNWVYSMADATMGIGVFLNDRAVYDNGLADWRANLRSSLYLTSDGSRPATPPGTTFSATELLSRWSTRSFVNGQEGETCRDASHMNFGLAALTYGAETASIQGTDLFTENKVRMVAAYEFNFTYMNNPAAAGWPCIAAPKLGGTGYVLSGDMAYTALAVQRGASMPQLRKFVLAHRPMGTGVHMAWETMTHGSAGL
ncbi:MAG: hypothetical protein JWN72_2518 [Thermoleophilia bacterium]|nr:hypothetical protein [Thermoleophilia bacterium]